MAPTLYYLNKSAAFFIPQLELIFNQDLGIYYFDPAMVAADYLANFSATTNYKYRYVEIAIPIIPLTNRFDVNLKSHICSSEAFRIYDEQFATKLSAGSKLFLWSFWIDEYRKSLV
jgi:hypothetical protein